MSINWTKPIRTVEGHYPCRVLCTDLKGKYAVVIVIMQGEMESLMTVTKDTGKVNDPGEPYVENIPEETFVWINVYEDEKGRLEMGWFNSTKDEAARCESQFKKPVGRNKFKLERRFDE